MKGHPKYRKGDLVSFYVDQDVKDRDGNVIVKAGRITGRIEIVDAYGAIGCDDVSYDIFEEKRNMLWKHVEEKNVRKEEKREK